MLAALIAVSALLVIVLMAVVIVLPSSRKSRSEADVEADWLTSVLRKRIVVHTVKDQSLEGTLWERTADGIILRAAKLLGDGGQGSTAMAGEVFVPRENIAFAQLDE